MNSKRLDPLLVLARNREEAAARELAEKNRKLTQGEQRLAELERYAGDYAAPENSVMHPGALLNRLAFRERIDDAVSQQARSVDDSRASCELERTRLMLAGRDTKVLEKLATRYQQKEQRSEDRKEQNQLDEFSAAGFIQRRERDANNN